MIKKTPKPEDIYFKLIKIEDHYDPFDWPLRIIQPKEFKIV